MPSNFSVDECARYTFGEIFRTVPPPFIMLSKRTIFIYLKYSPTIYSNRKRLESNPSESLIAIIEPVKATTLSSKFTLPPRSSTFRKKTLSRIQSKSSNPHKRWSSWNTQSNITVRWRCTMQFMKRFR